MRLALIAAIAASLALPAAANEHWPQFGDVITPTSTGLLRTTESGIPRDPLPFGTGFQDVMHTMVGVYGHEVVVGFPQECGAGPMVSATLPQSITLMFQDDRFVGWFMGTGDLLATDTGLWPTAPVSNLTAHGGVEFFDSGLGTEFAFNDTYGLLTEDGARIDAVWAGTNCIFR
ncbi:hypothetical protein [Hasllibacter sp. MH4015]|uniref:hypothetical protein n=1 Tax=Hasllibacter sp. MH4015 TaxID=2854029 RepID=UPI001CD5299A|nr:hypothetical protein [Hasllibacter sp. MH4015]